jgi:hypothetical protein
MRDGKHCPNCGEDIGIWPIFSAGLPNRIRCPHCKVRLSYERIWRVLLGVCALLAVVLAGSYYAVQLLPLKTDFDYLIAFLAIFFAVWVIVELLVANYLRNKKVLKTVNSQ